MYRRPAPRTGLAGTIEIALDLQRRAWASMRATPGLAMLSLILGFAVWLAVTDIENPTRVETFPAAIPVEAVNLDSTLAVANTLQRVEVTVSAPESRWQRMTSENLRAFVDLNGLEAREQLVPVQVEVRGLGGVRVTRVSPQNLLVNLEPQVSKRVPVVSVLTGAVPLGYEVTQTIPSQTSVQASGPASLVNLVQEAVAEVPVTGLTVELVESAQLKARGDNGGEIRGVRLEPGSVRVQVKIVQSILRRQIPLQATYQGEPASGYRVASVSVIPSALTIDGPIDVLQSVDSIQLPSIDVGGAREPVVRNVRVALPRGATTAGDLDVTVTVDVQPIAGTVRLAVPVTLQGGPPTARLNDAAAIVLLAGPLPTLNTLTPADVRVTAELTAVSPGTYRLPVKVDAPAGTRVVSVQPDAVSVTITSP